MTLGYILLGLGAVQVIWTVWRIHTYDPNRVSGIEAALHDVTRTRVRPKTRLGILIERSSNWYGLAMGLVFMLLGLIFANWSD